MTGRRSSGDAPCLGGGPRLDRSFFSTSVRPTAASAPASNASAHGGAAHLEDLRAHVAAGVQRAVEDAVIHRGEGDNPARPRPGLNARFVSALETRSSYKNVFVQPVAGNAGTAIGAVLEACTALRASGVPR